MTSEVVSADNWGYCPKCQPKGQMENHQLYDEPTLREDYEQFMSQDGEYYLSYRCACTNCSFHWEYRHKEQVVTPPTKDL